MRFANHACPFPVLRTLVFAIALGAGAATVCAAESDGHEAVAPAACSPSQPGCREVTFFIDNRLDANISDLQVLSGPSRWSDLGPLRPGMNTIRLAKPFVDLDHPGSYRIESPEAGKWLVGPFAYATDGSVHLTLLREGTQLRGRSKGIDFALLEDPQSDNGLSMLMSCSAGGLIYGYVRCFSEYLEYEGHAWGIAAMPLTFGHFGSSLSIDDLIGNPDTVLAVFGTIGAGGIGFVDQMNSQDLGYWVGGGIAVGGIVGEGHFSLPTPGSMRRVSTDSADETAH